MSVIDLLFNAALRPPLLFFLLGLFAALVRSDLALPTQISQFLALYLLLAIGFKGGVELFHEGWTPHLALLLILGFILSALIPIYLYFFLKKRFSRETAAAIAACYGSVSAVTFLSATSFLEAIGLPYHGALVSALALMEFPPILVAFALLEGKSSWRDLLKHLTHGSVLLLIGSLLIGYISPEVHRQAIYPLTTSLFMGFLCFFLLDMGMMAGRGLSALKGQGIFAPSFATAVPIVHGIAGLLIGYFIGASEGDSFLFAVLMASASYIAVPAAMKLSLPKADPALYTTMSLGLTFPFNLAIGIPLYYAIAEVLFK